MLSCPKTLTALVLMNCGIGSTWLVAADWPMFGRDITRNSVSPEKDPPTDWDIGEFDRRTGEWIKEKARNIRWVARLGSMTHGSPIVADGNVFIGTNNGAGYLKRYPKEIDLGCLLCFRELDGEFLWQYSAEKLPTGRVHDWPLQGIGSSPLVEGDRMWLVSNRWEVVCLDTRGFRDGQNDGPVVDEPAETEFEADVIWRFDMMGELGVSPYGQGMGPSRRCSPASYKNGIYVLTGKGIDNSHIRIPTPDAPSLICLDKNTGRLLWKDNSPGANVLAGDFASPLVAEIAGRAQVIVPQGDGWIRSFDAINGKLIWEFDVNRKEAEWKLGGRGDRHYVLATPVFHRDRIYVATGQEVEDGEGDGRLLCLDPSKSGNISAELAIDSNGEVIPHRRVQAVDADKGERAIVNPNSGLIWEFTSIGEEFEDAMHLTIASVAVRDDLLIATDYAGLVHCFDANTGKRHWYYDCFAAVWSTPLIVDEHVYVTDEDGEMAVFALSPNATKADSGLPEPLAEIDLGNMVAGSPAFANGTLYVATRTHLFAIQKEKAKDRPDGGRTSLSQGLLERTQLSPARGGVRTTNSASDLSRVPNSAFSPTPPDVVAKMLELVRVEEDDVVIDLGSGDGRIVVEAAKQFGCYSIGYELDPTLVRASRQQAREASLEDRVKFHEADLFTADLQRASVVTLYLNPGQNKRLIPQLNRMPHGGRVVAHEFPIPGITPDEVIKFESKDSGESHQLFLFLTPLTIKTIEP